MKKAILKNKIKLFLLSGLFLCLTFFSFKSTYAIFNDSIIEEAGIYLELGNIELEYKDQNYDLSKEITNREIKNIGTLDGELSYVLHVKGKKRKSGEITDFNAEEIKELNLQLKNDAHTMQQQESFLSGQSMNVSLEPDSLLYDEEFEEYQIEILFTLRQTDVEGNLGSFSSEQTVKGLYKVPSKDEEQTDEPNEELNQKEIKTSLENFYYYYKNPHESQKDDFQSLQSASIFFDYRSLGIDEKEISKIEYYGRDKGLNKEIKKYQEEYLKNHAVDLKNMDSSLKIKINKHHDENNHYTYKYTIEDDKNPFNNQFLENYPLVVYHIYNNEQNHQKIAGHSVLNIPMRWIHLSTDVNPVGSPESIKLNDDHIKDGYIIELRSSGEISEDNKEPEVKIVNDDKNIQISDGVARYEIISNNQIKLYPEKNTKEENHSLLKIKIIVNGKEIDINRKIEVDLSGK